MKTGFRPINTAWTPGQSSMDALNTQRIGGRNPGYAPHVASAMRLAASLSGRQFGWGTTHMLHASPTDKERHMRSAGLSNEHITNYGEDTWNTATHLLRQQHIHRGKNSPLYDTGPRDAERFNNQYED